MKIIKALVPAVLVLSAVAVTACGNSNPGPAQTAGKKVDQAAQTAGNAVGQAAQNTGQAISDSVITTKVKSAIFAEPSLKVLQIDVDTVSGVVTLTGTVDTQQQSDLATRIAAGIDGVKHVDNKLKAK
ncbi:MAG: BON domain-containing protein [Gammaproteobacteria bacterium]